MYILALLIVKNMKHLLENSDENNEMGTEESFVIISYVHDFCPLIREFELSVHRRCFIFCRRTNFNLFVTLNTCS